MSNEEKNISCNIFLEQIELLNQLEEKERGYVLYLAILKAFSRMINQDEIQDDNQLENQLETIYISISKSISLSILGNTILNLLNKTIKCKMYNKNWGGSRIGAGKKVAVKEDIKQSLSPVKTEKNNKQQIDEQFAVFYSAYPRKVGKAEARKKYEVALKKDSAEKILNGVKQYCKEINANKTEKQFIKHPSTWLNQQCWLDYDDIIETEVVDFEQKMRDDCYKRMLKEGQITEAEFNKYWENRGKEVIWQ